MYSCNRFMFLQASTTNALHDRSCNTFVAFRADVFETLISSWEIFFDSFQQTHNWNTAALKTSAVQQCTWAEACRYSTEEQKCIYWQQIRLLRAQDYHWQLDYTPVWKQCEKAYIVP